MISKPPPLFNFKSTIKYVFLIVVFFAPGVYSFSQTPEESLILYMPFNGNTRDESGYENHGTLYGAQLSEDRFGVPQSAYYFDGENDYIHVKASNSINSISGFVTLSAWVKPISKYYNTIFCKGSTHRFHMQLVKYLRPGIKFWGLKNIDYSGVENYWDRLLLYDPVPENEWTNFVCSYDSMQQRINIYINGELVHSSFAQGSINTGNDDLRIGMRINEEYPENFHGVLDDLRIYSRVLNESEVNDLYNEQSCTNYVNVYDTVTVFKSVTVTDTLFINFEFPDSTNHNGNLIIKVYPNPTPDFITIDTNGLKGDAGLRFKIINELSQILFESKIDLPEYRVDLSRFAASGVYQIIILNSKNEFLAMKKIILQ